MSKSSRRIQRVYENFDSGNNEPANPDAPDPSRFLSEDFFQVLDEHRKNCEREGKLDEAE